MFVLKMTATSAAGRYVRKDGAVNDFVRSPEDATQFYTREEALRARPGHAKEMGGDGYQGVIIVSRSAADAEYASAMRRRSY